MPVSQSHEKHIRAIHTWRTKNTLSVVSCKAEGDKCVVPERDILRAVLEAKITPRQTVEVVCRKMVEAGTFGGHKYRDLLACAGLYLTIEDDAAKLHLMSAYAFKVAFPGLQHAVPMLEECEGILVSSACKPVDSTCVTVVKPSRQRGTSKAKALPMSAPPLSPTDIPSLRKFVMSRPLAGTTVRELLKRASGGKDNSGERLAAFTTTMLALGRYGIMLRYDQLDLTVDHYAEVVDAKLLARRVPELKNVASSLGGLLLY